MLEFIRRRFGVSRRAFATGVGAIACECRHGTRADPSPRAEAKEEHAPTPPKEDRGSEILLPEELRRRAYKVLDSASPNSSVDEIVEMLRIIEELQLILDPIEWNAARLRPPASREAFARLTAAVQVVPPALEALYRWHDGRASEDGGELWGFEAVGGSWFLPIDEAILLLREIPQHRPDYSPSHFPYVGHNGGVDVHVVETAPGPRLGWRGYWDHEETGPAELEEPLVMAIRLGVEMSLSSLEQ